MNVGLGGLSCMDCCWVIGQNVPHPTEGHLAKAPHRIPLGLDEALWGGLFHDGSCVIIVFLKCRIRPFVLQSWSVHCTRLCRTFGVCIFKSDAGVCREGTLPYEPPLDLWFLRHAWAYVVST